MLNQVSMDACVGGFKQWQDGCISTSELVQRLLFHMSTESPKKYQYWMIRLAYWLVSHADWVK